MSGARDCALSLARSRNASVHIVRAAAEMPVGTPSMPRGASAGTEEESCRGIASAVQDARRFATRMRVSLLVSDWSGDSRELCPLLHLARELRIPGAFVRKGEADEIDRILVATGGGRQAMGHLSAARELSAGLGLPLRCMRIVDEGERAESTPVLGPAASAALARIEARLTGISGNVEAIQATDVVSGIEKCAGPGDLIVLGIPGTWYLAEELAGSIPDAIARRLPNHLVVLRAGRPGRLRIRRVFWERMVRIGLAARSKGDAITMLVDNLVAQRQLPPAYRDVVLRQALAREDMLPTSVGSETAFPHASIPGFRGIVGSLGIFPAGVDFGGADDATSRFVFLLVTPSGFSEDYLAILSGIARVMVVPQKREALLRCRSPREVLDVIDPSPGGILPS